MCAEAFWLLEHAAKDVITRCTAFIKPLDKASLPSTSDQLPKTTLLSDMETKDVQSALAAAAHPLQSLISKVVKDASWRDLLCSEDRIAICSIVESFFQDDQSRSLLGLCTAGHGILSVLLLLHSDVTHTGIANPQGDTAKQQIQRAARSVAHSTVSGGNRSVKSAGEPNRHGANVALSQRSGAECQAARLPSCCASSVAILKTALAIAHKRPAQLQREAFERRSNKAGQLKLVPTSLVPDILSLVRHLAARCPSRSSPDLDDYGKVKGYQQRPYAVTQCAHRQHGEWRLQNLRFRVKIAYRVDPMNALPHNGGCVHGCIHVW